MLAIVVGLSVTLNFYLYTCYKTERKLKDIYYELYVLQTTLTSILRGGKGGE